MSEFHLTHIALVGARISAFKRYGVNDRNQLAMRCIVPENNGKALGELNAPELAATLRADFPLWIHNIICDPAFPARDKLQMPLRRFEGELCDSKSDEVVASVLSAGFRNQTLDPLNLPAVMPLRQRCAIVMHIAVWQEAYKKLEKDVLAILSGQVMEIGDWINQQQAPLAAVE